MYPVKLPLLLCSVALAVSVGTVSIDTQKDSPECGAAPLAPGPLPPATGPRSLFERTLAPGAGEEAIPEHLLRVEKELRSRQPRLSPALREARERNLDALDEYLLGKRFPRNRDFAGLRPTFIDSDGVPCAVAHLMIESGFREEAEAIAAAYFANPTFPIFTRFFSIQRKRFKRRRRTARSLEM